MPRRRTPAESLLVRSKRQHSVPSPIASDTWSYSDGAGNKKTAKLQVGKPRRIPRDKRGDWYCAVHVEGWTPHVVPAIGIGPLDALMNALTLVHSFREHVADMHIARKSGGAIAAPAGPSPRSSTRKKGRR